MIDPAHSLVRLDAIVLQEAGMVPCRLVESMVLRERHLGRCSAGMCQQSKSPVAQWSPSSSGGRARRAVPHPHNHAAAHISLSEAIVLHAEGRVPSRARPLSCLRPSARGLRDRAAASQLYRSSCRSRAVVASLQGAQIRYYPQSSKGRHGRPGCGQRPGDALVGQQHIGAVGGGTVHSLH
jgi:hypothetical protein